MADGSSPFLSGLAYLLFATLALVVPGLALQRLARVPRDAALVLPLGFGFAAAAYALSLVGGAWLFPLLAGLALAALLWPGRSPPVVSGPSLRRAILPFAVVVAVLAATEYRQNRRGPEGEFLVDGLMPEDTAFHVGLAWELTLGYPPQVPGLSGFGMTYHLGQALVRAAAWRWVGIHPLDSVSRFDNTLGALALLLALGGVVRALGGSARAVTLVGVALIATDLSFVLAWNRGIEWWVGYLGSGVFVLSLLHANSVVPALALAISALVALHHFNAGEGRGYLALALLLSGAIPFFKVFVAALFLLGLGLAGLFALERRAALVVALPALVGTALLSAGGSAETLRLIWDPLVVVREARETLGLPPTGGVALGLWSVLWLGGSLGLRLTGIPDAIRGLTSRAAVPSALATMALAGWILGLLFRISPLDSGPRERPFNEALYFFEIGGLLLWIFVARALARLPYRGLPAVAAAALCATLCFPSTAQTLLQKTRTAPRRIAPAVVHATAALARVSRPGDVVLVRPDRARYPPPALLLIGRRVPYTRAIPFLTQFAPKAQCRGRFEEAMSFFETTDPARAREILDRLGARYVFLNASEEPRFDARGLLESVYEEAGVRVYRVRE